MNPLRLAAAAGRIPHRPTRRIAGGDRNNAFARLQGDVGHSLRRGIEPVERAVAERIDLDGIDERSSLRLLDRFAVGGAHPGYRRRGASNSVMERSSKCWRRGHSDWGRPGCGDDRRSEEHTSELQSLMRTSYAVFCLK